MRPCRLPWCVLNLPIQIIWAINKEMPKIRTHPPSWPRRRDTCRGDLSPRMCTQKGIFLQSELHLQKVGIICCGFSSFFDNFTIMDYLPPCGKVSNASWRLSNLSKHPETKKIVFIPISSKWISLPSHLFTVSESAQTWKLMKTLPFIIVLK